MSFKGGKIGGRRGHFQMVKEREDEKNEVNQSSEDGTVQYVGACGVRDRNVSRFTGSCFAI